MEKNIVPEGDSWMGVVLHFVFAVWWLGSPGNNDNNAYNVNNDGKVNNNKVSNDNNAVRADLLSIARNKLQVGLVCVESKGTVTCPQWTKIAVGRSVALGYRALGESPHRRRLLE